MADGSQPSNAGQIQNPITLIPVGLKEAALDSPTFRCGFIHFVEQLELVERWLENYVRSIAKLSHEVPTLEALINGFLAQSVPPSHVSEAVLDHDYTLLAMKRYGEGAKAFWSAAIGGLKKMESNMVDPIRSFLQNDMRIFKETRRSLDQSQRHFDSLLSRYAAQAKTKEASSLREDAFQLHEARKYYLKASMDFSVLAPQLRMTLDNMLVKLFSNQWRDTRNSRQMGSLERWSADIDRVRGWSREMEKGERAFRKELHLARSQIEESAEAAVRPSRELDDYAVDSASILRQRGPVGPNTQTSGGKMRPVRSEKQGWLNLRTVSGKPSKTAWLRRWFYVKNGIFGWLVQGSKSGAVEESDRIGVLLCGVRASNSDDRRYVFEVKTKDMTITVQAETQPELNEWLAAFEVAKQKALEDPASTESPGLGSRPQDPAFAISPPSAPDFAASAADSGMPQKADDVMSPVGFDRSSTLPAPSGDPAATKSSADVGSFKRANAEPEGTRDRFIQKLELVRKPVGNSNGPGGIASLIAASHGSMPVGPGALPEPPTPSTPTLRKTSSPLPAPLQNIRDLPSSTLAPKTLANPPAPTNLSAAAVIVNGDRSIGLGRPDTSGGIPSGLMANVWGTTNWGFLNRLERGDFKMPQIQPLKLSNPPSPMPKGTDNTDIKMGDTLTSTLTAPKKMATWSPSSSPAPSQTPGLDADNVPSTSSTRACLEYPSDYPLQLKTQDAQFRLLFPNVPRDERVVLVFKATWNPNEQQDFPGRVYVTSKEMYFYSNHCGMTMTTSIRLDSIADVTAATGRECDFIYLHLRNESPLDMTRITIKTFLEPLKLLQRRLNFLTRDLSADSCDTGQIVRSLIKIENEDPGSSPSADSWENVSINTPIDGNGPRRCDSQRDTRDLRANLLVDRGLYGDSMNSSGGDLGSKSFRLPKQPVLFIPAGMERAVVEKDFEVSPKALFHLLFGDKSAVWQHLYHERQAQRIRMGPWTQNQNGQLRRDFEYDIEYLNFIRQSRKARVLDYQVVDSANEHLLYVISDKKTPWHLPHHVDFTLLTKIVITHIAKSRCKLALYTRVDWARPHYAQAIISRRALYDLEQDALDLADVVSDQCRRLGDKSRTKKAVIVFGQVGVQNQVSEFTWSEPLDPARLRKAMRPHTMTSLIFEVSLSVAESFVTSLLQMIGQLVHWSWKTLNANIIILIILSASIAANIFLTSWSATDSWRERRAARYMARLGVGPDLTMTKSIYISDLEAAAGRYMYDAETSNSQCRDTFDEIVTLESIDPSSQAQSIVSTKSRGAASTALRLRNARQILGTQRHDLLVAMRIVNSIEREIIQAEWEHWLLDENAKCDQLGALIRMNRSQKSSPGGKQDQERLDFHTGRLEQAETWHNGYCRSCKEEWQGASRL